MEDDCQTQFVLPAKSSRDGGNLFFRDGNSWISILHCPIFLLPCCSYVKSFIFFFLKLVIFIAFSLKDSQNVFMQFLPLYTSCLFSMLLNDDIVDIEKSDRICCLTFAVMNSQDYFYIRQSFLLNIQDL